MPSFEKAILANLIGGFLFVALVYLLDRNHRIGWLHP